MATKGQIVEQVLRITNGGDISDDSKVTMQEVGVLLEHERDSLIRKTILENATLGEHEIPNEFISVHQLVLHSDTMYGTLGRPYVYLPQMPVNLPNDGSIYRVCKIANEYTKTKIDHWTVTIPDIAGDDIATDGLGRFSDNTFLFATKTGTHNVGRKLAISFKFGYSSTTLEDYKFTFDYIDYDDVHNSNIVSEQTLTPQWVANSLNRNPDFAEFLRSRKMTLYYRHTQSPPDPGTEFVFGLQFKSVELNASFGAANSDNMDIKSVLTNESIFSWNTTNPTVDGVWDEGVKDTYPEVGFGVEIWYPKNRRLKNLEGDTLGIKGKKSDVLNANINIRKEELIDSSANGTSYEGVTGVNMAKMWMNKNASTLKMYGIATSVVGAVITIREENPLGGFREVLAVKSGLTDAVTQSNVDSTSSERANFRDVMCYSRMPNPGMYSKMYDDAILLSGRKYWYRQESKLYLYNEDSDNELEVGVTGVNTNNVETKIGIWMLAKSGSLNFEDEFPMPSDAVSEVIKSLVATFGMMRQAKEDSVNDSVDIV